MVITPVEQCPNSSGFLRIELKKKKNCEQFVKDFEQITFFVTNPRLALLEFQDKWSATKFLNRYKRYPFFDGIEVKPFF